MKRIAILFPPLASASCFEYQMEIFAPVIMTGCKSLSRFSSIEFAAKLVQKSVNLTPTSTIHIQWLVVSIYVGQNVIFSVR